MHAAPSVTYPVGRSRFAGLLVLAVWLAGLAAITAWILQSPAAGGRHLLAGCVLAVSGIAGLAGWLRAARGTLSWDGEGWRWEEAGLAVATGRPQLVVDWQSRMLLHWHGQERARWLWAERTSDASHWDALRRAVYSRASTPVPPPGQPPVAEQ